MDSGFNFKLQLFDINKHNCWQILLGYFTVPYNAMDNKSKNIFLKLLRIIVQKDLTSTLSKPIEICNFQSMLLKKIQEEILNRNMKILKSYLNFTRDLIIQPQGLFVTT